MNSIEPTSSIKILETGFSRKGKSTLLNLIFAKLIARESYKWNKWICN
jgi:GTP-binding protein EngB required for normal cell division